MPMTDRLVETGYEVRLDGRISSAGTQLRVFAALVERAIQKREISYAQFAFDLNKHHVLKLLEVAARFCPNILDENTKALLALPDCITRMEILNNIYLACRILDDAIDGDSPRRLMADEISQLVDTSIQHFEMESWNAQGVVDIFLKKAMKECRTIQLDIKSQVFAVLKSMQFDAKRRVNFMNTGAPKFYPEEDLQAHYYQLDTEGTIGAMLGLLHEGNTEKNRNVLAPLGKACRILYDLQDLAKETRDGLVNISAEDAEYFSISIDSLLTWAHEKSDMRNAPDGIKAYAEQKIQEACELLNEYEILLSGANFQPLTKSVLKRSYENQCYEIIEKMGG